MAVNLSVALRNAMLNQIESQLGTAPKLRLYSGAKPTAAADAATGDLLCEITLPSDWLAAASSGSVAKSGTWQGTGAAAAGGGTNAGYFRLYTSDGTTCHAQGNVTATGGGGDLTMNNISVADGQSVEVTGFTFNAGNA